MPPDDVDLAAKLYLCKKCDFPITFSIDDDGQPRAYCRNCQGDLDG